MKFFLIFQMSLLVVAAHMAIGSQAGAQVFGYSASASASSLTVSNSVVYTIDVTNLTGIELDDVFVTNALPASVEIQTASPEGYYAINGSVVVFNLGGFEASESVQLTVTAEPTAAGSITNTITVTSASVTNTVVTNIVVQATNVLTEADLGVTITGPAQPQDVITNDWITYCVTVTNAGPDAATDVILTNVLPNVALLKAVPTNQTYTMVSSNLIFNLGTLTNAGSTTLQFTVEPTNAGVLALSASVGSANVTDLNPTNNFAATNITVIDYLPGTFTVVTNSAQSIDRQNLLIEQSVLVSNTGATNAPAVRLVVSGLSNQLFNAVGTNSGNPFVYYSAPLATGQSVSLLLQFPRGNFSITNGQLQAFAVPLPNWTPPTAATGTNTVMTTILQLADGNMLVEFPSTLGRSYTIVYSDNMAFSNAMVAPPSVVAQGNEVPWIDYGPPTTVSAPTNSGTRYYRVLLKNP